MSEAAAVSTDVSDAAPDGGIPGGAPEESGSLLGGAPSTDSYTPENDDTSEASGDNWRDTYLDGLDDDGKEAFLKHTETLDGPDALAKRYVESQKAISQQISKPGEDASQEDLVAVQRKLGAPEKGADYGVDISQKLNFDMSDADKEQQSIALDKMAEWGMQPFQVENNIELYAQMQNAQHDAFDAAAQEQNRKTEGELMAEWRGDYGKNLKLTEKAIEHYAPTPDAAVELKNMRLADGTYLASNKNFIKMFNGIARERSEDFRTVNQFNEGGRQSAQEQINSIRETAMKEDRDLTSSEDKKLEQLYARMLPEEG